MKIAIAATLLVSAAAFSQVSYSFFYTSCQCLEPL
jgi:hypothetical protein